MKNSDLTLQQAIEHVRAFHIKLGIGYRQKLHGKLDPSPELEAAAAELSTLAERMIAKFKETSDIRYLRLHLDAEELSEKATALHTCDELLLLDALADMLYVLLGTAVSYDLPLVEAFEEVHASNMTKERQVADPDGARVRQKGANYRAPDLKTVLKNYKKKKR